MDKGHSTAGCGLDAHGNPGQIGLEPALADGGQHCRREPGSLAAAGWLDDLLAVTWARPDGGGRQGNGGIALQIPEQRQRRAGTLRNCRWMRLATTRRGRRPTRKEPNGPAVARRLCPEGRRLDTPVRQSSGISPTPCRRASATGLPRPTKWCSCWPKAGRNSGHTDDDARKAAPGQPLITAGNALTGLEYAAEPANYWAEE